MSHSATAQMDITCPSCGSDFSALLWVIVDVAESPELVASIRDDSIHYVTCSRCGHGVGQADAPLLIYRLGYKPPILFSPCWTDTGDEGKESCLFLMTELEKSLGDSLKDSAIAIVSRPRLGQVIMGDLHGVPPENTP